MKATRNTPAWLMLVAGLVVISGCNKSPATQAAGPPPVPSMPVTIATASLEPVPVEVRVVGTVEPSEKVEIKSTIAGEITAVKFTEGQEVQQGDLLFEIDSRPYTDALRQAEAAVERDRAMLSQAKATLQKDTVTSAAADTEAKRYDSLMKDRLVSQQQNLQYSSAADSAHSTLGADNAAVESANATLNLDQVAVDKAKLDLSYCQIHSPISGRAGNLMVHRGNLVKVNDVALVVVNRMAPVFVSFNAPDKYLDAIRKFSAQGKLAVTAVSHEDAHATETGTLSLIDNTVDTQTGTIHLKATFENTKRTLWPGQFVDVALTLSTSEGAIVIPAEAVQAGQSGQMVYVVGKDDTVLPRPVTVGRNLENKVVIDKGLAQGERVVTDGQMMLFPGAHVTIAAAPQGPAGTDATPKGGSGVI
jgi:multidrug efflux system membrane fusion protein